MNMKKNAGGEAWSDPDDAPELTEAFFREADTYEGKTLIRRGRPPSTTPKQLVSLRLDRDVVEKFRATGEGWQTRINEALKRVVVEAG